MRKFSRINLKEELENIEFKRQNENEKEQKQMQRELEYLVFNIQFIEYLSIGSKKDNNILFYNILWKKKSRNYNRKKLYFM